jgi:transglutaminase-like putative cysteine protease
MSLKILEAHTAREFQVMVNVGWILCLCGFFLSQDLAIALCALVAFTLLVVSLIEFHSDSASTGIWVPLGNAVKMLAQAAPLIVLLFLLFPRLNLGLRLQMTSKTAAAGFSGELSPGGVSSLANTSAIAFRAEFPDGQIPRSADLYWRGVVLENGDGLEWRPARMTPAALPRTSRRVPGGQGIRQWITVEPHGNHWMFALDWPAEPPSGATIAPGHFLWSGQPIRTARKYEVTSFGAIADNNLHPRERAALLETPPSISPSIRALAQSWLVDAASPGDVVKHAQEFFRTERFRYSLNPGDYQSNDLDEFLFKRRIGFCEHYAASFATLMRLAGIPSRVVVGYLGGEYNELGRFFVVRQSDSHAWCEVWYAGKGWTRVDPTAWVAPDRVNLGLNAFLERRAASPDGSSSSRIVRSFARSPLFNQVRLAWQAMNYAWDTRVLSFDDNAQFSLLSSLSDFVRESYLVLMAAVAGLCVLLAGWFSFVRFRTRTTRDTLKLAYDKFCTKLARHGAQRNPTEGPADFATRAGRLLPAQSERIRAISSIYITLRYSAQPDATLRARFAREVKAFSQGL